MRLTVCSLVLAGMLLVQGCSRAIQVTTVPVQGRVVRDGEPITVGPDEQLMLQFRAEDSVAPLASFDTTTGADGTFTVPGAQRRGIPPGRYKVSVAWLSTSGGRSLDKLGGAFALNVSPLTCEVAAAREVVLDIGTRK